jgi:diguanylate cyclase (GGDEF)-like protein
MNVFLLCVAVHNCRSEKKNWFVLCMVATLLYVLGNFMEVTSHSTEAALNGVKVMYIGSCYMAPLFLLFILDYCEIKLKTRILHIVLFAIATATLVIVWTTEYTHLMYREFVFTDESTVRGLQVVEQGPAYYFVFGFALLCIVSSIVVVATRMVKWNKSYRFTLILLMLSAAAPLVANVFYILSSYILQSDLHGVNITPFALVLTNFLFYINVLRHDLFDFAPRANSATLDMIRDGVLFLDRNMNYTSSNEVAQSLFPELRKFGKGKPIADMPDWPENLSNLDVSDEHQNITFHISGKSEDEHRVFNAWVNSIRNGAKTLGIVVLIQDITDNIQLMKQLEDAAFTDGLTELYNRRHFMELIAIQFERTKRTGVPSCVLLFDLDYFKKVNDTYGHLAGDEVLRFVAKKVKQIVRAYDIVARYGGEEFVVFLSDMGKDVAIHLAERIREAIENSYCVYEDKEIKVTCSIGVTEAVGSVSTDEVLKKADQAMYLAKESGRNRVCVL